jgi:hypothetical protein
MHQQDKLFQQRAAYWKGDRMRKQASFLMPLSPCRVDDSSARNPAADRSQMLRQKAGKSGRNSDRYALRRSRGPTFAITMRSSAVLSAAWAIAASISARRGTRPAPLAI